jgi:phosphoribosyl 1,2-cyclic phosphodiesterase
MIEISVLASSSRGNCYRVTDGSSSILLECGISWKAIRQGLLFKTGELVGCLISHSHNDHCKSVQDAMKSSLDCYMSRGTADALGVSGHRVKIIEPLKQFAIGNWRILPFETQHDCEGSVGFLLVNYRDEKLLFITDSYYCKYKFNGLTHIMIECNHSYDILDQNVANGLLPLAMKNRLIRSHFSLENVKEFLKANDLSRVQEIWLLHLSDGNSDAERFKREIQELTGKMVFVAG